MTMPLVERAWPACLSALQLDRWMVGELKQRESDLVQVHVSGCERCARTAEAMRAQRESAELPRLRLLSIAPALSAIGERRSTRRWRVRAAAAVAGLAAAASLLLVVGPPRGGERIKGSGFALAMYVQHAGEVRRVGPGEAIAAGDAVRFTVTTPVKAYVAILSLDAKGRASVYYPTGATAQPLPAGQDMPLPLGTRLDESIGEERIVGLFCSSAVELEPVRVRLEAGNASFPHECQVTQWTFVKR
jgi:Domain of unknown function (DUF4384)